MVLVSQSTDRAPMPGRRQPEHLARTRAAWFAILTLTAVTSNHPSFQYALAKSDNRESSKASTSTQLSQKSPAHQQGKTNSGIFNLIGHGGPVRAIDLSNAGRRALTGSFDYSMILWDLSASPAKILQRFRDHGGPVNSTLFLQSKQQALSGSDDGKLRLFDLSSGELLHVFAGHSSKIVKVAIAASGKLAATASWDRTVRLWDLRTKKAGPVLKGHKGPINAVAFLARAKQVISGSYDGTIRLWDQQSGRFIREIHNHGWGINVLHVLPGEQQILFGTQNGDVRILDIETGKILKLLNPHEGPVLSLAINKQHRLAATGGGDGKIRIWNSADWSLLEEYEVPQGPVWSIDFTPDGEGLYFTGLDDYAIYWHINPRAKFERTQSRYPRRFQVRNNMSPGERQFARKCSICHSLTPTDGNRAGPTLYGVFGRKAGTVKGYLYSEGLKRSNIVWGAKTIAQLFDLGPDRLTPGSKMPLQKILNPANRQALISYLEKATRPKAN